MQWIRMIYMSTLLTILYNSVGAQVENWPPFTVEELECPQENDLYLQSPQVAWGVEGRAWKTIPPALQVRGSNITDAGLGVFSTTFLPSSTWLGEYDGEILLTNQADLISDYAWEVFRAGETSYCIDGGRIQTSNWLRWINCARTIEEENVKGVSCKGKILYVTIRQVFPREELLVYYGHNYAATLGINLLPFRTHFDKGWTNEQFLELMQNKS